MQPGVVHTLWVAPLLEITALFEFKSNLSSLVCGEPVDIYIIYIFDKN